MLGVGFFPHSLITKLKDTGVRYAPRHGCSILAGEVRILRDSSVGIVVASAVVYTQGTPQPFFCTAQGTTTFALVAEVGTVKLGGGIDVPPVVCYGRRLEEGYQNFPGSSQCFIREIV